jgi:hypothetical protein
MIARIYQIGASVGQSGSGSNKWILEFVPEDKSIDKVMGWASALDTMHEVKVTFDSQAEAIRFAQKNHYDFDLIAPQQQKMIKKSYADNFL